MSTSKPRPSLYQPLKATPKARQASARSTYHGFVGFPEPCDDHIHMVDLGPTQEVNFRAKMDRLLKMGVADENWCISHPSNLYPMDPKSHRDFGKRHTFAMVPVDDDLRLLLTWLVRVNEHRQMSKDMGLDVSKIKATHPALSLPDEHGQPRVFRYRFIVLRQHLLCDTARQQTFSILEPNSDTAQPYTVEDFQFVSAPTVHRPTKTPLPPIPHIRLKDVNDPTSHDPRTALNPLLVVCNAFAKFEYYTSSHAQARTDSLPRHVTRTINLVRDILLQLNFDPEKRPLQPPFALTAPATPPRSSDPYATPRAEETPRPNTVWEDVIEGDAESGAGAAGAGKKGEGLRQAKKFFNSLSPSKSLSSWKHRTRHGSKKEESPRKSRKDDGDSGGGLGSQMGNLTIQFEARTGQSSYAALLKPLSALDDPRLKLAYADLCSPPVEDSDEDEESDDDEDDDLDDDSGDGAGENENNGSGWESESDEEREERSE